MENNTNRLINHNKNVATEPKKSPTPSLEDRIISGADILSETRNNVDMRCNLLEFNAVCSLLKIGRSTLYGLVNTKSIKAVKLLGRTLFREADIYEFIANLPEYEGGVNGF